MYIYIYGFLGGVSGKESACQFRRHKKPGLDLSVRKISWKWQPTPLFSPGKSHGQRSRGHQHPHGCVLGPRVLAVRSFGPIFPLL